MKAKALLLLCLCLFAGTKMFAYDAEIDGIYYNFSEYGAVVTSTSSNPKYSGAVVIPATVTYNGETYNVTSIGGYSFYSCSDMTSITIPNSVTSIGSWAFYGCTGLASITIPNSVTRIDNRAFYGCRGLTSISIGSGLTSIDEYVFSGCTGLTSVNIGISVTSIGYGAFSGCSSLTSIIFPESLTSIGSNAFYGTPWYNNKPNGLVYAGKIAYKYKGTMPNGTNISLNDGTLGIADYAFGSCSGLTSITIPNSVTNIGYEAFSYCSNLTSITIPNSVTSIGTYAFTGCRGLISATIGNNVTSIGENTFYNCYSLTTITIPNSVTNIGNNAFDQCRSLTTITIPNSVTSIGNNAFNQCRSLTTITIPNSVTSIGDNAFKECSGLTSVTISNSLTTINNSVFKDCYRLTSITIPEGVTSIGDEAFRGCSGLNAIVIPNSVVSIGNDVFSGCIGLTSITIPNSVTSISNSAFSGCSGLTSFSLSNNVTSIGSYAFSGCTGLTSITIPNSVTLIGTYAFNYCTALTSITIPNSVTNIGPNAFEGTPWYENQQNGLVYAGKVAYKYKGTMPEGTKIVIKEGTLGIAGNAFSGCTSMISVTIPNSVTNIGSNAFSGCTGLTSVTIPNAVTNIGSQAFAECTGLTSITIPNTVTNIGSKAFAECTGLTSVRITDLSAWCNCIFGDASSNPLYYAHHLYLNGSEIKDLIIPDDVTSIGSYTFDGYSSLTSVTIPDGVISIGSNAFEGCSGLTSATIGNDVAIIGGYAFSGCNGLTSITIPKNVTSIGAGFLYQCTGLISVIAKRETPLAFTYKGGDPPFSGCENATLYVPVGCKAAYAAANEWKNFKEIKELIPEVAGIYYKFDEDNKTATVIAPPNGGKYQGSIVIPSSITYDGETYSVTSIGEYAFYGCTDLTSITIGNNVTSIGWRAFQACNNLTSIIFPNNVTIIGGYAFEETPWYNNQPDGLVYAGNVAYKYKGTMPEGTKIVLKEGTLSISDYAFSGCSGLTSITIPNGVTNIGIVAFSGCRGLTSVTIPESLTNLGTEAFCGCDLIFVIVEREIPILSSFHDFNDPRNIILYVPVGCKEAYAAAESWKYFAEIIEGLPDVVDGIYYSFDNEKKEAEVVYPLTGERYQGNIVIPSSVTYNGETYSVTSIGTSAFRNCSDLTSVTIPESVTSIGTQAFYNCTGLLSVIVKWETPINEIYYDAFYYDAFYGCGNATLYVPIGCKATYAADDYWRMAFKAIVEEIPQIAGLYYNIYKGSKTAEVTYAPDGSKYTGDITIPSSISYGGESYDVTCVADSAFYGCSGLTSVTMPNSVTTIGAYAFYGCSGLTSIFVPDGVMSVGDGAFPGDVRLYVNKGSDALVTLWKCGRRPRIVGTYMELAPPLVKEESKTQTTITYGVYNVFGVLNIDLGLEYECDGEFVGGNQYRITGLRPDYSQKIVLTVYSPNNSYSTSKTIKTLSLEPTIISDGVKASSISAKGSYTEGDANVVSQSITINGVEKEGAVGTVCGLDPNSTYSCTYKVWVGYGDGETYPYEVSSELTTAELSLVTQQPRVISLGDVIVAAESNLDDGETNVGFEWRRYDWPDEIASNSGVAYLYEGSMEGYIRNLYIEKFWRFRPYYESNSGNRYYGEWVVFDPTNTSYFEPKVHTYSTFNVQFDSAEVKGYVMRGTDNVTSQGFMYWENGSSSSRRNANGIPVDAKKVLASGVVMTATLGGLEYNKTYCYVAFVTTEKGETFYGEIQNFTDLEVGIDDVKEAEGVIEVARYDIQGRKIAGPQKGINVIRYSDGSTRKVLVK